jgi:hypothetical protein
MEHRADGRMTKVKQRWRIARHTFDNFAVSGASSPFRANPDSALSNTKGKPIGARVIVVVTGAARNVLVAAEDWIVKQKLSDGGFVRVESMEIRFGNWLCKGRGAGKACSRQSGAPLWLKGGRHMKHLALALMLFATPAMAEIEEARDLMEAGKFVEAREALLPAARSGNADAEELIGIMYAMGLGVPKDDVRAFEWYLRSAMKGHPGAQSGIGWYYEIGRGVAQDLTRAYMWYGLSMIGGDPDAAISIEEVTRKMTAEEIAHAQQLIDDYRPWLYPFR